MLATDFASVVDQLAPLPFTSTLCPLVLSSFSALLPDVPEPSTTATAGDEPGIVVGPNTLPFLHFSISALTLTYYDARNRRDASRELRESARS